VPDIVAVQELERLKQLPHHDRHLLCTHLASVTRANAASQKDAAVLLAMQAAQGEAMMCGMPGFACSTVEQLYKMADHALHCVLARQQRYGQSGSKHLRLNKSPSEPYSIAMYTSSEDGSSLPSTIRFGPARALLLSNMSDNRLGAVSRAQSSLWSARPAPDTLSDRKEVLAAGGWPSEGVTQIDEEGVL
jgi:hypothetical protein